MPKLFLHAIHVGLYNEKTINLYVAYQNDKQEMVDHKGRVIGDLYQHSDEFARHLKLVITSINPELKRIKKDYEITEIDYVNQSPFPTLLMERKQIFTQEHVASIREIIEGILAKLEMPASPRLFSKQPIDISSKITQADVAPEPRKTRSKNQ